MSQFAALTNSIRSNATSWNLTRTATTAQDDHELECELEALQAREARIAAMNTEVPKGPSAKKQAKIDKLEKELAKTEKELKRAAKKKARAADDAEKVVKRLDQVRAKVSGVKTKPDVMANIAGGVFASMAGGASPRALHLQQRARDMGLVPVVDLATAPDLSGLVSLLPEGGEAILAKALAPEMKDIEDSQLDAVLAACRIPQLVENLRKEIALLGENLGQQDTQVPAAAANTTEEKVAFTEAIEKASQEIDGQMKEAFLEAGNTALGQGRGGRRNRRVSRLNVSRVQD